MPNERALGVSHFRTDIEGLRAVAVLLVVGFHAHITGMRGGFVGVDVFFVLSGFLITGLLVRQLELDGSIELVKFFSRRVLRLLPAAITMLGAVIVMEGILLSPLARIQLSSSALATALYSSNIYFLVHASDYFAADTALNPLLHTWSLGVEEQFYLVWPLLLLIGWRVVRSKRRLTVLLSVFTVLSFAGEVWLTHKKQSWAFFAMPARAWEFGLGGIVALVPIVLPQRGDLVKWLGWGGLAMVVGCGAWLSEAVPFPGSVALVPVLGTCAVLIAGNSSAACGPGWLLSRRPLQWLGKRSYTWYLWHWPILVLGQLAVGSATWAARLGCVVLSLGAAALTTALIEDPIRFHRSFIARPGYVLRMGITGTLSVSCLAIFAHWDATEKGEPYARAAFGVTGLDSAGCSSGFSDRQPHVCVFGDSTSSINVVLFGDSHATEWFPALDKMAHAHRWRLTTVVKYSCPAADVSVYNSVLDRRYTECDAWRAAATALILSLRPTAVIVGEYPRELKFVRSDGTRRSVSPTAWGAGVRATVSRFDSAGFLTLLLRDSPAPGIRIPDCLSRAGTGRVAASACTVLRRVALDPRFYLAERASTTDLQNVRSVDLSDWICGPVVCEPTRDGIVVYKDANHLTTDFVDHITTHLDQALTPLIVGRGTVFHARPVAGKAR